jgi:FAD:protein FMN transferase
MQKKPASDPGAGGGLAIAGPGDLRGVQRASHEAMATVFEVHAVHPDARYAAQAARAAFDLVDGLERDMSRFLPNSDIARVNHLAAGQSTRVSTSTMECLVIARHVFELTGGAFDVSLGTGLSSLDLDTAEVRVRARKSGVTVDLGGIGKGYAVDRMAEALEEWGIEEALVHGGFSSVLALEPASGRDGWPLTLSEPRAPFRVLARLSVRQSALGASGLLKGNHIVDPRTGDPACGRLAAWVAVPRPKVTGPEDGPRVAAAAVTDALATAFMSMTTEEIEALCERSPGLEAWVVPQPAAGEGGEIRLLQFGAAAR